MPAKLNIFRRKAGGTIALDMVGTIIPDILDLNVNDRDVLERVSYLEQVLYALWVYWSNTEDPDAEAAINLFESKLIDEIEKVKLKSITFEEELR